MMVERLGNINAGGYQGQGSSVAAAAPVETSAPEKVAPEMAVPVAEMKSETNNFKPDLEKENGGEAALSSEAALKKAVEQINAKANSAEAVFGIHEATNRVTIKMVDKSTKEVIKEFPAEETLDLIAKAWELAGIMVDEKR